jgi:hypothetical protein
MTREQAKELLETARESLANSGYPLIYKYGDKINISRGDNLGIAEPVYNHRAEILVNTDELKDLLNPYEYDFDDAVEHLIEIVDNAGDDSDTIYLCDWDGAVVVHDVESDAVYEYASWRDIPADWDFGCDIEEVEVIEVIDGVAHIWGHRQI